MMPRLTVGNHPLKKKKNDNLLNNETREIDEGIRPDGNGPNDWSSYIVQGARAIYWLLILFLGGRCFPSHQSPRLVAFSVHEINKTKQKQDKT